MAQYRNLKDYTSPDGEHVDAGSLWDLINGDYILVDEDRFVAHNDDSAFAKA